MKNNFNKNKEAARKILTSRVRKFASLYNVKIGRISIRNQRTRWGSCSKKGNLNFHYKLIFMPVEIMDYVIVHEICHLIEFNHSAKFWMQVEKYIPNYIEIRRKLRKLEAETAKKSNSLKPEVADF